MSYLDRIHAINHHDPAHFRPLRVDGSTVGWLKHGFAERLREWPEVFTVAADHADLAAELADFEARSRALDEVVGRLVADGVIDHRHGELYPVTATTRENAVMLLDRAAAPYFGIRAFGQHLNGYVRDGDDLYVWIARRSASKRTYPGKLDNMVAGGLPHGADLEDNLAKECWEEASIPAEIARRARRVSEVSYRAEVAHGLKPDTMYCYDLELPPELEPRCNDDEVESFQLLPIEQVMAIVRDGDQMKENSAVTLIDFLIRHGRITPQHPEYADLLAGLRG